MSDVLAKFKVHTVSKFEGGMGQVTMAAVTGGSDENKQFWKHTPAGEIKISIDNDAALEKFNPGDEFYVTFSKS